MVKEQANCISKLLLCNKIMPKFSGSKQLYYLMVSVGQESGYSLARRLWFRVSHRF